MSSSGCFYAEDEHKNDSENIKEDKGVVEASVNAELNPPVLISVVFGPDYQILSGYKLKVLSEQIYQKYCQEYCVAAAVLNEGSDDAT